MIGRAGLVALLTAPTLGAQGRWEDRDQDDSRDGRPVLEARRRNDDRRDAERHLFTWRGSVDDETRIFVRAANIESQVLSGRTSRSRERVDRDHPLPHRDGTVRIQLLEGRGRVHVIQQPAARNGYTAILRVKDAAAGRDMYRFAAYFDPVDDWSRGDRDRVWSNAGGDVSLGQRVFRWTGNVDGDVQIVLRRGSVDYRVLSGEQPSEVRTSGAAQVPRRDGQLGVSLVQGRGTVVVTQQPTSYNNYTTIVRVIDRPSGTDYYDFDLIWR